MGTDDFFLLPPASRNAACTRTGHNHVFFHSGKFILDGLVSAGILKDDNFQCVELCLKAKFGCSKSQTKIEIEELK